MRRIDHVVVAVRDLERAAEVYRTLGFQVGARNQHPWGTENRLIQFRSSFIELITVGERADLIPPHESRRFSFGAFVRDSLQAREGIAMLVLDSDDAAADAARFARQGIGDFAPFSFERTGTRPDGSAMRVAFTLAFAVDVNAPRVGLFVCQQHVPEHFWNPDFQQHPNGATNIVAVSVTAGSPRTHADALAAFCEAPLPQDAHAQAYTFALDGGRVDLVAAADMPTPLLTSLTVRVPDTRAVANHLDSSSVPFTVSGADLVVSPAELFGVELRFERLDLRA